MDSEERRRVQRARKSSGSVGDLWREERLLFFKKKSERSEFSSRTASPIGTHPSYARP